MDSKPESEEKEVAADSEEVVDATQETKPGDDKPEAEGSLESPDPGSGDPDDLDGAAPAEKPVDDLEEGQPKKKSGGGLKALKAKKNIYVILFVVLMLVAGGVTAFSVMKGTKKPPAATIGNQPLSQDSLKQLANSDASVGASAQTLTVQSNAIFSGQLLARGNVTAAGNLQTGGSIQAPDIVISGTANLGATQIKTLQVATDTVVQGNTSLRDLAVAGNTTFNGPVTASQITVTKLILSGNGILQIPNHISFTGATPGRAVNSSILGAGGTANVGGSDVTGTVTINTGTGPSAGCYIQINFNKAFSNTPHAIISPVGEATGSLNYYVTRTTTSFSVCSANTPASGTVYIFDYFVTD